VEIGGVVVFSRIYNYYTIAAVLSLYIYICIFQGLVLGELQSLSCDHTKPHQVAIALDNAAESSLSIGIRDSQTFNSYCPETYRQRNARAACVTAPVQQLRLACIDFLGWRGSWDRILYSHGLNNEEASHKERQRRRSRQNFCLLEGLVQKPVLLELVLSSTS
jgi:hypothetical protein